MQAQKKIPIALTEDNLVNRNTFKQKFEMMQGYDLQFIANSGHDCLDQLKKCSDNQIPQVIFMDIEMPGMDGIETISIAKALYPQIHFIILTVFDDDEKIFEAIRAGASGYLLKHESAQFLQESINHVLEFGGAPMSPAIARKALNLLSKASFNTSDAAGNHLPDQITSREEEILKFMVNGWDAKRIAATLFISVLTVRKHIANIYDKLHVQSRAEVINMAHRNKWFNQTGS